MAFILNKRWTKWCDTIRPAVCPKKKVSRGHLYNEQHSVRWDMRPRAFVVFKETTIGGRSRAISLRSHQPLGLYPSKHDTRRWTQHDQSIIYRFQKNSNCKNYRKSLISCPCLRNRLTHMILSSDQSEGKQSSNGNSKHCSCGLAYALFLVTVKVCIPPKLHKALK